MTQLLYRLGRWAVRRRRLVVALWVAAAVLAATAGATAGGDLVDSLAAEGTESDEVAALLSARFPAAAGDAAYVVVAAPEGETVQDPEVAAAIEETAGRAARLDGVAGVASPLGPQARRLVAPGGGIAYLEVRYAVDAAQVGAEGVEALQEATAPLADLGAVGAVGGPVAAAVQEAETGPGELVGLGAAVVILLLAFGSAVAMALPIVTALVGIVVGLGLTGLVANGVEIPTLAPTIATMLGLAIGIDYALFIVTRHREHLATGMTVEESVGRAIATAGNAVVFAGLTVVIAILGMWTTGIAFVGALGTAAAITAFVAVLLAVSLLPALLGFAGRKVDRVRLPRRPRGAGHGDGVHGWVRWSRHVTDRPWRYLAASLAALLVMTVPFLSIDLAFPDAGNDPAGSDTRVAYDLLAEGFGPGVNGPLVVAAQLPAESPDRYLRALGAALADDPGVARVAPPQLSADGRVAVLGVIPTTRPQEQGTIDLVERLRGGVLDDVDAQAGAGAEALVGGFTAASIDLGDRLTETLPQFIAAVIGLSFLLLTLVFRSVLVPLKAAFMNLLSILAAYGVVTAVFQWGWGLELVGLSETLPIPPFLPVGMFAILFGLSMDYEVFLLSRIREDYLALRDNHHSVATGLAGTAKVITSAAAIMIAVFLAFVGSADPELKMIGVGLATAVLVDATIVRLVLVPATMALLGDANWWLPGWLDRWLPRVDLEGDAGLPAPEYVPGAGPDAARRRRRAAVGLVLAAVGRRVRDSRDGSALARAVADLDRDPAPGDGVEARARRAVDEVLDPLASRLLAEEPIDTRAGDGLAVAGHAREDHR